MDPFDSNFAHSYSMFKKFDCIFAIKYFDGLYKKLKYFVYCRSITNFIVDKLQQLTKFFGKCKFTSKNKSWIYKVIFIKKILLLCYFI